jgi:two-component system chemotaxis response regulator CheB
MGEGRSARRVVVIEDSPTVCAYLRALASEAGFEVVGAAHRVADAEALVRTERPDLVLSDVHLPDADGIELTRRVLAERGVPIVLITAHDHRNPELVFRALQAGALEVLPKPPARSAAGFPAYLRRFETTLRTLAGVPVVKRRASSPAPAKRQETKSEKVAAPRLEGDAAVVAIGASTGGPVVVGDLLRALNGRRFAFAVVAQHIVPDFADSFRGWLAEHSGAPVRAARDGEAPEPGGVYTIPGSCHLQLTPAGRFRVVPSALLEAQHVPSIDALFSSLAALRPRSTVAILLTGMGRDGAAGLLELRAKGALTVAQSPESSAVDSMPRSAIEKDAAALVLAPPQIAGLLEQLPAAIRVGS